MIWHQSLLAFVQRYKHELDDSQRERINKILRIHSHHLISPEIRRELAQPKDQAVQMSILADS